MTSPRRNTFPSRRFFFTLGLLTLLAPSGCDLDGSRAKFKSQVARTTSKFSPAQIKSACLPLFAKFPNTSNVLKSVDLSSDQIPPIIASLPIFEEATASDISLIAEGTNELRFMIGSGFGHWGLAVFSDSAPRTPPESAGSTITTWTNGIYFFREK